MFYHLKVFANTETNTTNPAERLGNFFLTSARRIWKGHSIKFCQVRETPLKMHAITNFKRDGTISLENPKFYDYILIIFTTIPGLILKGISYCCSSETRQRHYELVKSYQPFNLKADGIRLEGTQSYVTDPEYATGRIIIELSKNNKSYEEQILEKLSLLSPSLDLHSRTIGLENYDSTIPIDIGLKNAQGISFLDYIHQNLLYPTFTMTGVSCRCNDYFSKHGACVFG